MRSLHARIGRILAVSGTAAILTACAGHRAESADERRSEAPASDTVYIPGTGDEGGTGTGGAPSDPTVTDTAGEFGDPNAWPTGPLPSDTGIGGAGTPMPDTAWIDTAPPEETFGTPEDRERGTGGGAGPDVF